MKKQHSRIGLISSLFIHSTLFASVWWAIHHTEAPKKATDELTNISMEMMTALLEQPQVAVSPPEPEPIPEPEPEPELEPEPEPEPIPEPEPEPEEKPKPIQKPKPPKKKVAPKVKALEKGKEIKKGVEMKQIATAIETNKLQIGESGVANTSQANEINAYKARLQRALQKQANTAYPEREKRLRRTGSVMLSFRISSEGRIIDINIIQSSGNNSLDAAAIQAAKSVDMKTPPPAGLSNSFRVPIKFSII